MAHTPPFLPRFPRPPLNAEFRTLFRPRLIFFPQLGNG
jgi:hypothetical protein